MEDVVITGVIIDLYPIISKYVHHKEMFIVYRVHPLKRIITKLLMLTDNELDTLVDTILVDTFGYETTMNEVIMVEAFLTDLVTSLETYLYQQSGALPVAELILDEWIDQTSVLLRKE